jgi:hypothetical protein
METILSQQLEVRVGISVEQYFHEEEMDIINLSSPA